MTRRPDNPYLSPRMLEIMSLLANGKTRKQVSSELGISVNTVRSYLQSTYQSLGVKTLIQALLAARKHYPDFFEADPGSEFIPALIGEIDPANSGKLGLARIGAFVPVLVKNYDPDGNPTTQRFLIHLSKAQNQTGQVKF